MSTQLTYHREGDYMIPNLTEPEVESIGIWGRRRKEYLRKHRNGIYTGMLLSGKLNTHLAEIDRQAEEMCEHLTRQMAAEQGVTEQLKAENQIAWVGAMNNIRNAVEEVTLNVAVNPPPIFPPPEHCETMCRGPSDSIAVRVTDVRDD